MVVCQHLQQPKVRTAEFTKRQDVCQGNGQHQAQSHLERLLQIHVQGQAHTLNITNTRNTSRGMDSTRRRAISSASCKFMRGVKHAPLIRPTQETLPGEWTAPGAEPSQAPPANSCAGFKHTPLTRPTQETLPGEWTAPDAEPSQASPANSCVESSTHP